MTLKELTQDVIDEITFSGAMPFKIPTREIERIIRNAEKYFHDYWRYALQKNHLIIPHNVFMTHQFQRQRGIFLPDCVKYVQDCREMKGSSIFGSIDRDLGDQKFIGSELFLTPFMGEALTYRIATFAFLDLTKNLTIDTVAYDYNHTNHYLQILGRTPKVDLYLQVARKVESQYLFENELFQRFVRAKAKLRLHEMLSATDFQLPGGFKYNYTKMDELATKEIDAIYKTIDDENTPDFLIMENY